MGEGMSMDAGSLSALLVAVATFIGWMVTSSQARARSQRTELRGRRKRDLLKDRWIFRLEAALAKSDQPLPAKPPGLEKLEGEEW